MLSFFFELISKWSRTSCSISLVISGFDFNNAFTFSFPCPNYKCTQPTPPFPWKFSRRTLNRLWCDEIVKTCTTRENSLILYKLLQHFRILFAFFKSNTMTWLGEEHISPPHNPWVILIRKLFLLRVGLNLSHPSLYVTWNKNYRLGTN